MGIYGVLLYDPIVLSYADAEGLALSTVSRGIICHSSHGLLQFYAVRLRRRL